MLVMLFWLFALLVFLLLYVTWAIFVVGFITAVIGFAGIVLTTSQFWLLVGGLLLICLVRLFK